MGRVRRAWRKGVREEPALYVLHLGHRLEPGGSGPGAARTAAREGGGNFREVYESRTGRPWERPAAYQVSALQDGNIYAELRQLRLKDCLGKPSKLKRIFRIFVRTIFGAWRQGHAAARLSCRRVS